jgi:hypothetical protein
MFFQDDEMSWLDKSCLQLVVRRKDKTDTLTFQVNLTIVYIHSSALTTAVCTLAYAL